MARELSHAIIKVRLGTPEVMKSFSAMAKAATEGGVLDIKTEELMALAIAVAIRSDGCIAFHALGEPPPGSAPLPTQFPVAGFECNGLRTNHAGTRAKVQTSLA